WNCYLKLVRRYAYPKPFARLLVRSAPLRNGQVVAGNVRWRAAIRGPMPSRIDFLVDGKPRWSDRRSPFAYAGGGPLRTLDLANGRHTLRVVAVGKTGHSAAQTIAVRVRNVPLALTTAGIRRWQRVSNVVSLRAAPTAPTRGLTV